MTIVTTSEAEKVMKRCQIGTRSYDEANNLHAECYGTIGSLTQERDKLRDALNGVLRSDVGRQTMHKLEGGQGTETGDGKAWLDAARLLTPNAEVNGGRLADRPSEAV